MLWRHFANEADDVCDSLQDWIVQEIKALTPTLQAVEAASQSRQIRSVAQSYLAMLRELSTHRVPDIVNLCKMRIEEVLQGGYYEDPFEACDYLRDGTRLLESTARELYRLRDQLDGMMEPSDDVPTEPGSTPPDDPT